MRELKYIEKIRSGKSLLSMPQSLSRILSMIDTDDFSMGDLSNIIMKDPGLTSKVLRMANSAFYRQRCQIATVNQAVMMLGVMQVKCLALSTSVFQSNLMEKKLNLDIKEMFSHFISVGLGSQMLAEAVGMEATEEAFVAGLIHDIGMVFFIDHFPDDYRQVIDNIERYSHLIDAERDILGIDHATIGEMLADKWCFPASLRDAIAQHHQTPEKVETLEIRHLVQLSRLINKPLIDNRPQNLEHRLIMINQMAKLFQIDRKKIDEISFSILTETIAIAEYMGIDIGDTADVLSRANKELYNSYITIENLFRERQDLSRRILIEERRAAMMETKNVAIATLSHYINNAAMAISGRGQLIKMLIENGTIIDEKKRLHPVVDVIDKSVKRIIAVLQELRELTSLEEIEKYSESEAINIDDRIKERLRQMEDNPSEVITVPDSDHR